MATATDEHVRGARLGLLERFPWRRIVLIILSIVIVSVVAIGAYKTLTLPADERYTRRRGRTSSSWVWPRAPSSG